ncbi:DUF3035 domain-containing protein [Marinibaculum pumilum]|uniref:DUF3035 domain-containing protein n=1 Tax=Marinibaculum pumilum TaxID=1766165 RepID=A0ABV7L2R3_9PROT
MVGNERGRPVRRAILVLAGLAMLAGLPGCDSVRNTFGLNKQPPDEFAVLSRAPLTLPPDFQLRPPDPGAPRPQEMQPEQQAQAAVFGTNAGVVPAPGGVAAPHAAGTANLSAGEQALLAQADAEDVDPSIRRVVNEETTALIERDQSFINKLVFWQAAQPPGEVVDPTKERDRLQETSARGQPPTTGTTPTIERRERGILEGIF